MGIWRHESVGSLSAEMLAREPFASFVVTMQNMLKQLLNSGQGLERVVRTGFYPLTSFIC